MEVVSICQGNGLKRFYTRIDVVEWQYPMTSWNLIFSLPETPLYVFPAYLTAVPGNLPSFEIRIRRESLRHSLYKKRCWSVHFWKTKTMNGRKSTNQMWNQPVAECTIRRVQLAANQWLNIMHWKHCRWIWTLLARSASDTQQIHNIFLHIY